MVRITIKKKIITRKSLQKFKPLKKFGTLFVVRKSGRGVRGIKVVKEFHKKTKAQDFAKKLRRKLKR